MREFTIYNLEDLQFDIPKRDFFALVVPEIIYNYLNETGRTLRALISIDGNIGFIALNTVENKTEAYVASYGIDNNKLVVLGPESVDVRLNDVAKQLKSILDSYNPDEHYLIRFTAEKHEFDDIDSNNFSRNSEKYLSNNEKKYYKKLVDPEYGETLYVNYAEIIPQDEIEWGTI